MVDTQSRHFDLADWGLTDASFELLGEIFPPFEVDLFASAHNARCEKFFTEVPSPAAAATNAYAQNWARFGFGYCVPPIAEINAAIRHINFCASSGVLIVPLWRASNFWLTLAPDGVHFSSLFAEVFLGFPELASGIYVTSNMFRGQTAFQWAYLRFQGHHSPCYPVFRKSHCSLSGCSLCC
jgi:hypothetical protein